MQIGPKGPLLELQTFLNGLSGKQLFSVGRTLDMLWLHLGGPLQQTKLSGEVIEVGEYALHTASSWRFSQEEKIIVGKSDIFIPRKTSSPSIGLSDYGLCVFDQRIEKLNKYVKDKMVALSDAKIDLSGNLELNFTNSITFDLFVDTSIRREIWRFLDFSTRKHIVAYRREYKIE